MKSSGARKAILLIVSLVITAVCLYYVFRKINFSDLVNEFGSIRWLWVAISMAVFWATMYLRAFRWKQFFPVEDGVKSARLLSPMMVGYMLNSILPGRVGEFVRPVLVGQREKGTTASTAFATVIAERTCDMVMALGMFAFAMWATPVGDVQINVMGVEITADKIRNVRNGSILFVAVLILGIALMMMEWFRAFVKSVLARLKFLPAKLIHALNGIVDSFSRGFQGLTRPVSIFWIAICTVIIWMGVAWSFQLCAPALGLRMSLAEATAVTGICCLAVGVLPTPGYWGAFEAGAFFSVQLLQLQGGDSKWVAYALLLHATQYFPTVAVGFLCAYFSQVSLVESAKAAKQVDTSKK